MKIAERIYVQNVRETGRQAKVLTEASEHVPGITLKNVTSVLVKPNIRC